MPASFLALLCGAASLFVAASWFGHFLYQPGSYRLLPWGHLAGSLVLFVAAAVLARRTRGHRWSRRAVAFSGAIVAGASCAVLWLFLFAGARLPERAPPSLSEAPEFVLFDDDGDEVRLSTLRGQGPVVVAFFRGIFDFYGRAALTDLERARPDIEAAGGSVLAISGDPRAELEGARRKLGLGFPLLSDLDLTVTAAFEVLDAGHAPHPSVFVVAPDGSVPWVHVFESSRDFPETGAVVAAVRAASAR